MKKIYTHHELLQALDDLEARFKTVQAIARQTLQQKEWLTTAEFAAQTGLKPKTVSNYVGKGRFSRTRKAGNGTWLIHRAEVERWVS